MKRLEKILPYNEINFRWISKHHDVYINGTCMLNNKIHYFENNDYGDNMLVLIYGMSFFDKLKWIIKQWIFEQCVGYHCTCTHIKQCYGFYYRNPKWLYKRLFNFYYKYISKL